MFSTNLTDIQIREKTKKQKKTDTMKGKQIITELDEEEDKFPPLRTRVTTKSMWSTIKNLSIEQKECIINLGLGSMLDITLDIIPADIGHHVVLHYDPNTNCIDFGNTRLQITEERIHAILGIPNKGIDLSTVKKCKATNPILIEWKAQNKDITTKIQTLCDLIEKTDVADDMFILNFITLFVNTMIEKTSSGATETSHLRKLVRIQEKGNVNWCKYINDILKDSKKLWKPYSKKSYYNGPLPFLVVSNTFHLNLKNHHKNIIY